MYQKKPYLLAVLCASFLFSFGIQTMQVKGDPLYQSRLLSEIHFSASNTGNDDDNDGVLNRYDKCPDTPAGVMVDANGCPEVGGGEEGDQDGDGVLDINDQCPNTPLGTPVGLNGCPL